eukprot:scaffold153341_cov28-Tisochrysis_lutea.AAC.1
MNFMRSYRRHRRHRRYYCPRRCRPIHHRSGCLNRRHHGPHSPLSPPLPSPPPLPSLPSSLMILMRNVSACHASQHVFGCYHSPM